MNKIIYCLLFFFTFGFAMNAWSQWTLLGKPLNPEPHPPGGGVRSFIFTDSGIFVSGFTGVFRSTNNGVSWDSAGLSSSEVFGLIASGIELFAGVSRYGTTGLFHSTDYGKNWTRIDSAVIGPLKTFLKINTILIAAGNYVFRSTDNGVRWNLSSTGPYAPQVSSLTSIGNIIFASSNGAVFRSTDSGISWGNIDRGLTNNVFCLNSFNSAIYAATDSGIFRTMDLGITWDTSYVNPNGYHILFITSNRSRLFAATNGDGVLYSGDSGRSWKELNDGLTSIRINTLGVNDDNLFAGDDNGKIWRHSLSDLSGVVTNKIGHDLNISLSPNPTTGIISIHNEPENLRSVAIMNVLGEKVLELANPHTSDFSIDLSKFVQGMYYARFLSGSSVVTKKIVKE